MELAIIVPNDSIELSECQKRQCEVIDSLKVVISQQEKQLNQNYQLFMKARQDDADLLRIISLLGAFIIGLAALFGVKSAKDIKIKVINDAKSIAKSTAKDTATKTAEISLQSEVTKQLNQELWSNRELDSIKNKVYDDLNRKIFRTFESRISELESKIEDLCDDYSHVATSSHEVDKEEMTDETPVVSAPLPTINQKED